MTSATGSRVLSLDEAAAYRPQQVVDLSRELSTAQHQIAWFERQIFGQKSERRIIDGDDSLPFFDDSRVPVEVIELVAPEAEGLAPEEFEVIGRKDSYRLAQRPGSYVVLNYRRPVIKIKATQTIVSPAAPVGVIEGSRADVSFVAGLLIDKFAYHLPFYRQHQRLTDGGITVSRPWLTQIGQQGIALLEPIYDAQFESIRASRVKAMDDALVVCTIALRTRVCSASRSRPGVPDRES